MSFLKLPLAKQAADTIKLWAKELRQTNFVTDGTLSGRMAFYGNVICPIAAPILWLSDTIPDGFIVLDGSTIPRSDFPNLFDVYKYTYGGSGPTFVLPDLSGSTITVYGVDCNWITRY